MAEGGDNNTATPEPITEEMAIHLTWKAAWIGLMVIWTSLAFGVGFNTVLATRALYSSHRAEEEVQHVREDLNHLRTDLTNAEKRLERSLDDRYETHSTEVKQYIDGRINQYRTEFDKRIKALNLPVREAEK